MIENLKATGIVNLKRFNAAGVLVRKQMKQIKLVTLAILLGLASFVACAADDRFFKENQASKNGFMPAKDPLYVKECGSCHFPYSPGLLPARSWDLQLQRMGKHFGEAVGLNEATRTALRRYLTANAADVSPYEGSKAFMERIKADNIPYRLADVHLFRGMHTIIRAMIDTQPGIKVRKLTNCNGCHQGAEEGSFGLSELFVPGLTLRGYRGQPPDQR